MHLKKAIFLTPGNADLYSLRAEAYVQSADLKSAVLNFKKCMTIEEQRGRSLGTLKRRVSRVYDAQGLALLQPQGTAGVTQEVLLQAVEAFKEAREVDSLNPGPPHHLALAQLALHQLPEAMKAVAIALSLGPTDARLYLLKVKTPPLPCVSAAIRGLDSAFLCVPTAFRLAWPVPARTPLLAGILQSETGRGYSRLTAPATAQANILLEIKNLTQAAEAVNTGLLYEKLPALVEFASKLREESGKLFVEATAAIGKTVILLTLSLHRY